MKTPEEIKEEANKAILEVDVFNYPEELYIAGYQSAQSSMEEEIERRVQDKVSELQKELEWKDARMGDMMDHISELKQEIKNIISLANGTEIKEEDKKP